MDGWFLLQAGGKGRAVACLTGYYKTQPEREKKCFSGWICENLGLSDRSDHCGTDSCSAASAVNPELQEKGCVVCCPKRSELKNQLAVVTCNRGRSHTVSFIWEDRIQRLPDVLCTFQHSNQKGPSNRNVGSGWHFSFSSVIPHLLLFPLSVINCLDGWFPLDNVDRNMLLLSSAKGKTIHLPIQHQSTRWHCRVEDHFPTHER